MFRTCLFFPNAKRDETFVLYRRPVKNIRHQYLKKQTMQKRHVSYTLWKCMHNTKGVKYISPFPHT